MFCWCGRLKPCNRHCDKEAPKPKKRIGKYSGYSRAFELNHGSEEVKDDD
jgi:hypothetical protein